MHSLMITHARKEIGARMRGLTHGAFRPSHKPRVLKHVCFEKNGKNTKSLNNKKTRAIKEHDAKSLILINARHVNIIKRNVTFYGSDLN